jgi:hypothetical protein
VEGFSKTTDLLATTPSWSAANKGLSGVIVKGISRVTETEQDSVAAVTNVGVAVTKNFSSSERKWLFPACTGRKTCWNDSIALAPANPNIVFAGTEDIERGYITADPQGNLSITWDLLLDNPSGVTDGADLPVTLQFRDFPEIPARIFGLYQWVNSGTTVSSGGIYSVTYSTDPSDTSFTAKPVILADKPIKDLIALNSSTMYAAVKYTGTVTATDAPEPVYRLSVAGDGSVSEQIDTSGELGADPGVTVFGYDKTRDVLYAAGRSNAFYILEQASTGTTSWSKGTNVGPVTALTIDQNGDIFVSRFNEIYRSADKGQSWEQVFLGLNDEELKTITVSTNDIPATGPARAATAGVALAVSPSILIAGSSTGLNEIAPASPTPQVIPSTCSLALEKKCARGVRRSTKCLFTATLRRKSGKTPLAGRVLALQIRKAQGWRKLRNMTTKASGQAAAKVAVTRGEVLRARIDTATVKCTTKRIAIK